MVITQGLFDDNLNPNKPTEVVILDANGEPRMLNVERNRWHSLVCLESGSVLYESKDGAYQPLTPDEIMEFPAYEAINDTDSRYLDKKTRTSTRVKSYIHIERFWYFCKLTCIFDVRTS